MPLQVSGLNVFEQENHKVLILTIEPSDELKALQQCVLPPLIDDACGEAAEDVEGCVAGEVAVKAEFAGQVADLCTGSHPTGAAVLTEHKGLARAWSDQIDQDPDGGGLSGAVQSKKSKNLASLYLK